VQSSCTITKLHKNYKFAQVYLNSVIWHFQNSFIIDFVTVSAVATGQQDGLKGENTPPDMILLGSSALC
jgi:hypothetical protein